MKAMARISMIWTVVLVLLAGTVMQFHHHDESHVCVCLNPVEHCIGHHHHGTTCLAHGSDCSHRGPSDCALHLSESVSITWQHMHKPTPDFIAVIFDSLVIKTLESIKIVELRESRINLQEGFSWERRLRGPPAC